MSTPPRFYSSTALPTNLTATINNSATTVQVASTDGFPASTPFTLALDYGAANEELVDVTAVAGLSLTVTRGVDNTPASTHNTGALVRHTSSARDFREAKEHELGTTNVHGFTPADGEFVGTTKTQTLSNKTLVRATGTLQNVDIFNVGSWATTIVGDSTDLNHPRLSIIRDEVSLTRMAEFQANGALYLYNGASDGATTYRLRTTNLAGTADRFYVLTNGQVVVQPDPANTNSTFNIFVPDATSKVAFYVGDAAGTSPRHVVYNDGHVDINNTDGGSVPLDVRHVSASPSSAYFRILDSANLAIGAWNSDKRFATNYRAQIGNVADGTLPVFQVFANTTSQTGDLQQWVDQSGVTASRITSAGDFRRGTFRSDIESLGSAFTAGPGWSVTFFNTIRRGGWILMGVTINRTGGDINPTSGGNITGDPLVGTVTAGFRPTTLLSTRNLQYTMTNGVGSGTVQLQSDTGELTLVDWSTGGTVTNNDSYRFTLIYPVD